MMSVETVLSRRPRDAPSLGARTGALLAALACLAAVGIGVLGSISPEFGIGAFVAMVAVPAAVLKPKLIAYLLIVSVFAEAVTVAGVTVDRLVAPLALIAVISHVLNVPVRLEKAKPTLTIVGAYLGLAVASMAWTVSQAGTIHGLGSLAISVIYMAGFAVLITNRKDLRSALWAIGLSAPILGILYIAQFARGVGRTENTLGDPNFFAAYQVMAIPLILVLASTTASLSRRVLLYFCVGIVAASVLTTLSRGGMVTLLLTIMIITVLPWRVLYRSHREKTAVFLAAIIGIVVLFPFAWAPLDARFKEGFRQQDLTGGRGDLWLAAAHGYVQHPLTGLGYGAFDEVSFQLLSQTPGVNLINHVRFAVRSGEEVHNAYLSSLVQLGPIGLLLFVGILWATARALLRASRRARASGDWQIRRVSNALIVSLVAFAVSSLLLSTETSRALWLVVGLSLALPGIALDGHPLRPRPSPEALQGPSGTADID
jgi:O-antigen ligase